ncbi:hypothetical protein TKK_0001629 [Trichogramma kaykai]
MAQVVAQLSYSNGRNSQQRGHSPGHRRDSSQHRGRSKSPGPPNICWYHRKHGKDAERCTLPCLFDPPLIGLRRDLPWDFVVADVPLAILGADFLAYFGLLLDCKNQCLVDPLTGISAKGTWKNAHVHSVSALQPASENSIAQRYEALLKEFADLIEPSSSPVKIQNLPVKHSIVTYGPPVAERPRRLTGERLAAAKEAFDDLLKKGIIRPSNSQWASPLHLVPKSNSTWRVTGDYRRLNSCTVSDMYPLPIIEDLLQESPGNVFSTVDLQKAFYQIPVTEEDIEKTAVTTPFGLFEFLGTSLGLRNSAQSMQRTMNHILRNLPFAKAYIDDIFVALSSHEEHLAHLRQLFTTLREANLKLNQQKCTFGKREVLYLGFQVTPEGFSPPDAKIEPIEKYAKLTDATELRRFLGMLNYYRQCIPSATKIQPPLHELLKGLKNKKSKLKWTSTVKLSANARNPSSKPLARHSYVPMHRWHFGLMHRTKRLAQHSSNKTPMALGRKFTTYTDHKPLIYAAKQRSDKASPRQVRSFEYISRFNTDLKHSRGSDNVVADALSRISPANDSNDSSSKPEEPAHSSDNETPSPPGEAQEPPEIATITMPNRLSPATIAAAQEDDEGLMDAQAQPSFNLQQIVLDEYEIWCYVAHGSVRPYLPTKLRRVAYEIKHLPAHPGVKATARAVAESFVWPGVRKEVSSWTRCCNACQLSKVSRHNRSELGRFTEPDNRFEHIHIDLIKLPLVNEMQYCLTIIDRFSRWPMAIPLRDMQANTVAQAMFQWIRAHGAPIFITSDRGAQFESTLFTELAKMIGTTLVRTTSYHLMSNGMIERFHRTLKAALKCSTQPWTEALPSVLLGLRTSYKEDLKASPAEMLYGTTLRIPGDFFLASSPIADKSTFVRSLRQLFKSLKPVPASRHTTRKPFVFADLNSCSHVFKRIDRIRKLLEPPYSGPHCVVKRIDQRTYEIEVNGEAQVVSTDQLKPAHMEQDDCAAPPTPPQLSERQPAAEIPSEHQDQPSDSP